MFTKRLGKKISPGLIVTNTTNGDRLIVLSVAEYIGGDKRAAVVSLCNELSAEKLAEYYRARRAINLMPETVGDHDNRDWKYPIHFVDVSVLK